jgi:hypothetical protein
MISYGLTSDLCAYKYTSGRTGFQAQLPVDCGLRGRRANSTTHRESGMGSRSPFCSGGFKGGCLPNDFPESSGHGFPRNFPRGLGDCGPRRSAQSECRCLPRCPARFGPRSPARCSPSYLRNRSPNHSDGSFPDSFSQPNTVHATRIPAAQTRNRAARSGFRYCKLQTADCKLVRALRLTSASPVLIPRVDVHRIATGGSHVS